MNFLARKISPPKALDAFEDLCLMLFQAVWQDPHAQKNERQGQEQRAVDVFGKNYPQGGGLCGVQCKVKDSTQGNNLSRAELLAEIAKADAFVPPLQAWILATTANPDPDIQEFARSHSAKRAEKGLFPVTVYAWDEIHRLLAAHPAVAKWFYPGCFPDVPAKPSTFYLPDMPLSPHFVDPLHHLDQLRRQLTTQKAAAVLAANTVPGMGGVGKTQLALKYCHTFRADYAGVWWFSAENSVLLETECMTFCAAQQIPRTQNMPAPQAMANWLAAWPTGALPWLLVYDNADDAYALKKFLPHAGPHHVLVTSRLRAWAWPAKLRLDVWRGTEALAYLQARLPQESEAALLALADALGGLPLALEQACAYLANHPMPLADYIERVKQLEPDIARLEREPANDCPNPVLITLMMAYENLSFQAQALLQLGAYFAAQPVPEYVFTDIPDLLPPLLQNAAPDRFFWRWLVGELERYALCQAPVLMQADFLGNNGSNQHCMVWHRLTQTAVRLWLGQKNGANAGAAGAGIDGCKHVIMLLSGALPYHTDSPEHWPRCHSLMPHVQRLEAFFATENVEPQRYAALQAQLALYLRYGPALLPEALRLTRLAFSIRHSTLGEEYLPTLISMNSLADILRQQGDLPEARLLQEKYLGICRRVLGDEHPYTLTAMNNLAATLRQQEDLPGARQLYQMALELQQRVLGEEDLDTLSTMNHLALTLRQQGDLPSARLLHKKALTICRRVQGEEHPETLTIMNNLAATLSHQGDQLDARRLEEKVLEIRRRVQGEEHLDTLISMNNLATTLWRQGELHGARQLLETMLDISRRVLGAEHPQTMSSEKTLAFMLKKMDKTASA